MCAHEIAWTTLAFVVVALVLVRLAPKGGYFRLAMPSLFGGFGAVTSDWGPKDRENARLGLWLDGLFIVLYCRWFWLLLENRISARHGSGSFLGLLETVQDWVWAVGVFDVLEDLGILGMLRSKGGLALERVTTGFALVKFAGFGFVAILLLIAFLLALLPG